MIKTEKGYEFIHQCVLLTADFRNSGQARAADAMLDIARRAIQYPMLNLKMANYTHDLKCAIQAAYGAEYELADLSIRKQLEALWVWEWFYDVTREVPSLTLMTAIAATKRQDQNWHDRKENIQRILSSHPTRVSEDASEGVL